MFLILTLLLCFYVAWNIGANDVGNNMGTPVSAGSLSFKNAVLIAVIFEFLGAVLVGGYVVKTISTDILNLSLYEGDPRILIIAMFCSLLASGFWITIATVFKMPVSTTHSIIGAVVGAGLVTVGAGAICWAKIKLIAISWLVSPFLGGLISYIIFNIYKYLIFNKDDPFIQLKRIAPFFVFIVIFTLAMATIYKGLKNLHLNLDLVPALLISVAAGAAGAVFTAIRMKNKKASGDQVNDVEDFSKPLHVIAASYECFAHGANDVANAVGPVFGIIMLTKYLKYKAGSDIPGSMIQFMTCSGGGIPPYILLIGAAGIVLGITTFGKNVMETIGKRITEITPSRGFASGFATATTVLLGSRLGCPLSSTHIVVGTVAGVGIGRGIGTLNAKVLLSIFMSWFLTLPVSAGLCVLLYLLLKDIIIRLI